MTHAATVTNVENSNEEPEDVYVNYAGDYIAMRYMAKQFSGQTFDYDEYRPKIKGNDQLNYFDDVKRLGTSKADTIVNVGDEVSINGKNGDDVTIKIGGGNDTISIESGSAWSKDYSARKDTLLLADGASTRRLNNCRQCSMSSRRLTN